MNPESEECASLPVRKLLQWLGWLYDGAINGFPGVDALEDLAESYGTRHRCVDEAIDRLITWQVAKAGAAGFATGLGGALTLPVAIAGVLYIQIRMIGAIAHLRGYDVRSDQVKTLVVACLAGSAALDILKDVGINIGAQVTRQMILRISGQVLRRINRAVGFRLVTKAGSRGAFRLSGVSLEALSMPPQLRSSAGQRSGSSFLLPLKKQLFELPVARCFAQQGIPQISRKRLSSAPPLAMQPARRYRVR